MDKVAIEEIREGKRKEIKDKRTKRVAQLRIITNRTAIKIVDKRVKAQFRLFSDD